MSDHTRHSKSVWMRAESRTYPALENATTADVCIVGAGIAGITVGYLLAREGLDVVLLDAGTLDDSETIRTTAHLSNAIDDHYFNLVKYHGEEGTALAAESHTAAIDKIEAIVGEEGIDCGFSRLDGYLFVPPGQPTDILDQELAAAHRAGLTDAFRLDHSVLADFDTGPSLCFPRQAEIDPIPYLATLRDRIQSMGGRIYSNSRVESVVGGAVARVTTSNGVSVSAASVVVATNTPINDRLVLHTKMSSYRSYVIAMIIPRGAVKHALYWDTDVPYRYVRVYSPSESEHDYLIVGGEDHKVGQDTCCADRYAQLEQWARERFPISGAVAYKWSGQIIETIDGLAFIGRNPLDTSNVYVVAGDSGHGITHSTIAGLLLCDLIQGRPNRWQQLYDPSRKSFTAAWNFTKENLNVAARYADYFLGDRYKSVDSIPCGEGGVLRQGISRIALYKDENGIVHERSAVCPHLGCVVAWNSCEKSWDCPCHGSRFDAHGNVIHGPAIAPLAAIEIDSIVAK